ncbi:cGMP-dependent protein kinase [Aureococcus anophagefferens]|nr:cGMP-dependent protein kinase [Aureococcus anophagefferens]
MSEASVDRGAHVLRKGDIGDAFYVLKRGESGSSTTRALVAGSARAYFGETAILKDTPRNADVVALEPCGLLKLTRDDFVKLLGPLEDALNAEAERRRADLERSNRLKSGLGNTVAAGFVASRDALRSRARTLKAASVGDDADAAYDDGLGPFGRPGAAHGGTIRVGFRAAGCAVDFGKLVELDWPRAEGAGAGGRAQLVRDDSGGFYTLRIVSKRKVFAKSWDQGLLRERAILTSKIGESPVARCLATGSNRAKCVVLAEALPGGDLYGLLHEPGDDLDAHHLFGGDTPAVRYYAGCALRGVEHLHSHGVAHRAVAPEHLWIDARGALKLHELPCAVRLAAADRTNTLCGGALDAAAAGTAKDQRPLQHDDDDDDDDDAAPAPLFSARVLGGVG